MGSMWIGFSRGGREDWGGGMGVVIVGGGGEGVVARQRRQMYWVLLGWGLRRVRMGRRMAGWDIVDAMGGGMSRECSMG